MCISLYHSNHLKVKIKTTRICSKSEKEKEKENQHVKKKRRRNQHSMEVYAGKVLKLTGKAINVLVKLNYHIAFRIFF